MKKEEELNTISIFNENDDYYCDFEFDFLEENLEDIEEARIYGRKKPNFHDD